jgi:pimeloyl-ACP methyl ester carboxylesterase
MSPISPVPARAVPSGDGVTVALHDLGGHGPPVLYAHPTGFLALTWGPLAGHLAPVAHGWGIDLRGHGDSTTPASGDLSWEGMAADVLAVVDDLAGAGVGAGPEGLRGVGHSLGGAVLLMAEQRRPGTFRSLWLYEPIVAPPPEGRPAPRGPNPLAAGARRRRPWFPDRAAAYANFTAKPPLSRLDPAALAAYVDHGLRDLPDGQAVELKCRPEVEARVFDGSFRHDTHQRLGEVACPVTVAIGGDGSAPALWAPATAAALPHGRLERHPTLSHFGPLEDPAAMADAVRAALDLG